MGVQGWQSRLLVNIKVSYFQIMLVSVTVTGENNQMDTGCFLNIYNQSYGEIINCSLFLTASECEKFFWSLGLKRRNQDQDPLEIYTKRFAFQEVFDEIDQVKLRRRSNCRAVKMLKNMTKANML